MKPACPLLVHECIPKNINIRKLNSLTDRTAVASSLDNVCMLVLACFHMQHRIKWRPPFILNLTAVLSLKLLGWFYASVLRAFSAIRYHYSCTVHVSFRGDFVCTDAFSSWSKGMSQRIENTEACSNHSPVLSCSQEKNFSFPGLIHYQKLH